MYSELAKSDTIS